MRITTGIIIIALLFFIGHDIKSQSLKTKAQVTKSDTEWLQELGEEVYRITRQKATETPFTGAYWDHKEQGNYHCRCCELALFASNTKYKSGTGWPSFYDAINDSAIVGVTDESYGMQRTEIICSRCHAHLGHVFKDGPSPTFLRYCVNSASLQFRHAE